MANAVTARALFGLIDEPHIAASVGNRAVCSQYGWRSIDNISRFAATGANFQRYIPQISIRATIDREIGSLLVGGAIIVLFGIWHDRTDLKYD